MAVCREGAAPQAATGGTDRGLQVAASLDALRDALLLAAATETTTH